MPELKISIIVPAYNEEKALKNVLNSLFEKLDFFNLIYEIIAINDGSTDKTEEILNEFRTRPNFKIINHPYNKGYGASLKTGARNAQYDWLLFFDADGQHNIDSLQEFIKYAEQFDMVVGWRQGYQGPFIRQPGKKILLWIANYLVEKKIPDINCGFRMVKKNLYLRYLHLLPNTFSASTTITMVFLKEGLNVKYVPITLEKRIGQSSVKSSDAAKMMLLILRVIMLFNPLKVFMPISLICFLLGFLIFIIQTTAGGEIMISKSVSMFMLASIFLFSFGLLSDQIAALRREAR